MVTPPSSPVIVREKEVVHNSIGLPPGPGTILRRLVYLLADAIVILLGIRFVFLLLGLNPQNGLVNFIYGLSRPLVNPFSGLFSDTLFGTAGRVEWNSIAAIIFYIIIAYLLVRVLSLFYRKV